MCGRFTLRTNLNKALDQLGVEMAGIAEISGLAWEPRFNIAPTTQVLTISQKDSKRVPVLRKWGLIPSWAKDAKVGNSLINARADGVADKPSFRSAFKRSRCLVVADGFYEWKKLDAKTKQPYFIHMKDDRPFAFAGLSEWWKGTDPPTESATIITTDANPLMAPIHDRMPVILPPESYDLWLDPEFADKEKLLALLKPYPPKEMVATPVSTFVNSPRNQGPECVEALA